MFGKSKPRCGQVRRSSRGGPTFDKKLTKAYLLREYATKGRSAASIAAERGCQPSTVIRYLVRHGVAVRKKGSLRKNLAGKPFGFLVAEKPLAASGGKTKWICLCKCGRRKIADVTCLVSGVITSCGCKARGAGNGNYRGTTHVSKSYWGAVLRSSTERQIECSVTMEDAEKQLAKQRFRCALTGISLVTRTSIADTEWNASLDRRDFSKGYVKGNIQWIHKDVNRMKWHYDQDYFIALCSAIHKYRTKKAKR